MRKLILMIIIAAACGAVLNIDSVTRRCVNGVCGDVHMPLYIKAMSFVERHHNYKQLADSITGSSRSPQDRVIRIFDWCHANIRKVPEGFPVVDDHIWNIVIRGYGASDQVNDVFVTLCVYAGVQAYWDLLKNPGSKIRVPVSYVNLDGRWIVFDPYRGIYFRKPSGALASVDDLLADKGLLTQIPAGLAVSDNTPYVDFYRDLKPVSKNDLSRVRQQMPWPRLFDIINRRFRGNR